MAEAKGPIDLTGYFVLSRTEQLDEFLRALGFPWVVRKAAAKFGTVAAELTHHTGTSLHITSLNAKGSWTRTYDTEHPIEQLNVEGVLCKTTAWWEGSVLRTRLEGSPLGVCESWRYRRGDVLVVRTTVKPPSGKEATCFSFFERMESLERHVAGSKSRPALLRALAADQKRVQHATCRDTADLMRTVLDWDRWASPADEFIRVSAPSYARRGTSAARLRGLTPAASPGNMSKTPSAASLAALQAAGEGRAESRIAGSRASAASEAAAELAAAPLQFAKETTPGVGGREGAGAMTASPAGGVAAPRATPPLPPSPGSGLTFPSLPAADTSPGAVPLRGVGSVGDMQGCSPPAHRRQRSTESASGAAAASVGGASVGSLRRPVHYRSTSADSASMSHFTPASPTPSQRSGPPTGTEALMALKMHEFLDGRGILAVVPVATPNDTSEPQLLSMSPEQAEETAAKLRDLETEMLLHRQNNPRGFSCCGLVISWEKDTLPEHLRVWEMTINNVL